MAIKHITLGTRGSALALRQADIVADAIRGVDASVAIEISIIQTHGDVDQRSIPLDTNGKGWFTKEIEAALLEQKIDIAMHSLKDMAEDMPTGLHIGAYLPREDARDVLITKNGESLEELKTGAIIGTDSMRRQVQMQALWPDVVMESLRGNVLTRLQKLDSGKYDAIILAAAGLKRLDLENRITRYFEVDEMTPSPGQGIIAIQTREHDTPLEPILAAINDPDATRAAKIERSFSLTIGGGCKAPVGAYAFRDTDMCRFVGMRADSEMKIAREEMSAPWDASEHLGEMLAKKLLQN